MRRIGVLVAIFRAAEGVATSTTAGKPMGKRLLQAAWYSTSDNTSVRQHHWFTSPSSNNKFVDQPARAAPGAHTIGGTMLFSVATSVVSEEVQAKESVQPKLRPNDVVLYQYEACPFCNKVKGIHFTRFILY